MAVTKIVRKCGVTVGDLTRIFMVEWSITDEDAADMVEHALRSTTIDFQRQLRSDPESLRAIEDGSTVPMSVAAFKPGRRAKDPVSAARKAFAKLTEDQIARIVEEHTK